MKKVLALFAAAITIAAVAGCTNKPGDPVNEETASVQETTEPVEESGTTSKPKYTRETIIVTDENGESHKVAVTTKEVTIYTTTRPSPSRLTSRPTSPPTASPTTRTTRPITTKTPTTKAPTTKAPTTKAPTTASSFKEPVVDYGGTLGTASDNVQIKSHTTTLSQNNTLVLTLNINILQCSGTTNYIYIGYNCYDASGKKLNNEPVKCVVSVKSGETKTISIATAPINTAKIVFCNI